MPKNGEGSSTVSIIIYIVVKSTPKPKRICSFIFPRVIFPFVFIPFGISAKIFSLELSREAFPFKYKATTSAVFTFHVILIG